MLSPLRNRFGIPGVISVIALVFAMLGGAYAASNDSGSGSKASASAGKQGPPGPRGKRGKRGKPGPAGPVGPAGPAGAKGDTGAAGANGKDGAPGKDGTNGTSATTATFAGVKGSCTEGGVEVKSATPDVLVCNGVKGTNGTNGTNGTDGSPWTAGGVLPPGETETGTWAVFVAGFGQGLAEVSFPIPLAATIAAADVHRIPAGGPVPAACDDGAGAAASVANPEADPGHLCVFTQEFLVEGSLFAIRKPADGFGIGDSGAGVSGALLIATSGVEDGGFGTWAVTAPTS